jgi:hypothetical protein
VITGVVVKRIYCFSDPGDMPGSGLSPETVFANALPIAGTPGQKYSERRGIPVDIADAAAVRFDPNFGGRPAVLVALRDKSGNLTSVHGRYLQTIRGQNKMLTVGVGGGALSLLGGWRIDPFILVEGLFDGLSLAACGWPSVATIGRYVPWLTEVAVGRKVWAAFDAGRPGEANVALIMAQLQQAEVRRLAPPPGCKDWSTAIVKRGSKQVAQWVRSHILAKA